MIFIIGISIILISAHDSNDISGYIECVLGLKFRWRVDHNHPYMWCFRMRNIHDLQNGGCIRLGVA